MRLNGCHNRQPYKESTTVQDGWIMDGVTRVARMVAMPFRMSQRCEYSRDPMGLGKNDERCTGCKWRASESDAE